MDIPSIWNIAEALYDKDQVKYDKMQISELMDKATNGDWAAIYLVKDKTGGKNDLSGYRSSHPGGL